MTKKIKYKKNIPYWAKRLKHLIKRSLIVGSPSFYWRLRYAVLGYPEPELKLIDRFCSKDLCAIDVGGNYGMYTFFVSRRFSICHTFEPQPYFESIYKRGFKGHNVVWRQVALSDTIGTTIMQVPVCDRGYSTIDTRNRLEGKVDESDGIDLLEVETNRLDAYNIQSVGFIKVDVEGHEQEVLKGAVETIASSKPVILVEIEERHREGSVNGVVSLLAELGYECWFLFHKELVPFSRFTVERNQNPGFKRDYIRNFIFIHRDGPAAFADMFQKENRDH
ncbi:MAG: FkbM family methyltransferase [bacterium]|nr:FkbM family methyltransferase [bacterium]